MRKIVYLASLLLLAACQPKDQAGTKLTIFAAASTTDVMKELAEAYETKTGTTVQFNFAASGALARQIEAGTPADVYISANTKWMDFLEEKGLLENGTRADIVKNALVLIAPQESAMTYAGFPNNLKGKLAVGDFKSVPAGSYAQAALTTLGLLDAVTDKLVKGSNVRTVLMYVERGEADAGIVYQTDAIRSKKVQLLGIFPPDSHPPIIYPAASLNGSDSAKAFLAFIQSEETKAIWRKHGFSPVESSE